MEGTMEGQSESSVISIIKGNSFYPLKIEEIHGSKDVKDLDFFSFISLKQISILCRQLSTLLHSGIPMLKALGILSRQIENGKLRGILEKVSNEVQRGASFSESLKRHGRRWFPPILIHMIKVGELSGALDASLENIADYFEKEHKLKQKIQSAMVYPVFVGVVAMVMIYFVITNIVPGFVMVFTQNQVELPRVTQLLIGVADFLNRFGWLLIPGMFGFAILFKISISQTRAAYLYHRALIFIPYIGKVTKKILSARFSRTMSVLVNAGIPIIQSLSFTAEMMNHIVIKDGLKQAEIEMKHGRDLSDSIKGLGIFPTMVCDMLRVGEETGAISKMLDKTADFYENEVQTLMNSLAVLIEPVIILALGGMVAFIVLSVAIPMFRMIGFSS